LHALSTDLRGERTSSNVQTGVVGGIAGTVLHDMFGNK
jgi:hypothetical protein